MATLRQLSESLYGRWLEARCFLLGLRIAWVSTASAAIGFALFFSAPPAQDILLEVKAEDDPLGGLVSWGFFYLVVILFWALPVFVSARWILTRFEANTDLRPNMEPVPIWVQCVVPAFLAVLCFVAVLAGQIIALGTAPTIDENARASIADARRSIKDDSKLRAGVEACRRKLDAEGCRKLVTNFAIVAGDGILGGRRNVPKVALGIGAFLILWFYIGRGTASSRLLSASIARRIVTAIAASVVVAFTVYQVVVQFVETWSGPAPSLVLVPLLLVIPVIVWLAWQGRERWVWWLGSLFAIAAAVLVLFALYGIVEAERSVPFSPVHLFLLPFVTVALAALAWWSLARQQEGQATRIGKMLLRMVGVKGEFSDSVATARLVNPVFYALLVVAVALIGVFALVEPLQLTAEWHLNRGVLLSVVLGLPVAVLTYLTYWSVQWRVPLIVATVVVVGTLSLLRGWLWGDYYTVRSGDALAVARPTLHQAVEQWARANECNLPKSGSAAEKPCPAPIIVTAAGGASRAAFHVAGVVGALMDGQRLAPLAGHRGSVYSAEFSRDAKHILTASLDTTARIWDARTGAQLAVLRGHKREVYNASFSPDGNRVVTASWDHTAKIWNVSKLGEPKEIRALEGHRQDVNSASFSPDGRLIVTASDDKTARIWDAETGHPIADFFGHQNLVHGAGFSPSGRHIITAAWDHTARIWDVPAAEEINNLIETKKTKSITISIPLTGHTNAVNSAAFSPDGKLIVTASSDKTARIWAAETGVELARMEEHSATVFGAAFSPDGKRVATAAWDRTARIWDVPTAEEIRALSETNATKRITVTTPLRGHTNDVNSATFRATDGKVIVTASDDKTARIWDAETGVRKEWEADQVSPFAKHLFAISAVSGGSLGAAVVYAALADNQRRDGGRSASSTPPCNKETIRDQDWFGSRSRTIVSGEIEQVEPSEDPQRSWKACLQLLVAGDFLSPAFVGLTRDPLHPLWMAKGDRAQLLELAWEKRYDRFTRAPSAKGDGNGPTIARPLSSIRRDIDDKGWLPILFLNGTLVDDGKRIITSDIDTSIRDNRGKVVHRVFRDAYDFHELYLPPDLKGHWAAIRGVAVSPHGDRIASASDDGTARIWDTKSGAELAVLSKHDKRVNSALFSPDGTRVVTASWDRTAMIWDISNLSDVKPIKQFKHDRDVNSAAFSPDGRLIVTASDDATARIWDAETGHLRAELPGHREIVYSAAFDRTGNRVVTASFDRSAKIWDVSNLREIKELKRLQGHTKDVMSAAFSPDGKLILTASADKTARLWDAETGDVRAVLPEHGGLVYSAVFSPDGKRVLTGAGDHIARIWDVSNLDRISETRQLKEHDNHVTSVAFSRSGNLVISGSRDRTVRIRPAERNDAPSIALEAYRDGRWTGCPSCDVRLSTAATMSARFPIISPSGTILGHDSKAIRVVDGGYHENFGAITAKELANFLEREHGLRAAVIFVNNDPAASSMECVMPDRNDVKAANSWLWDPLLAIIGTQTARGSHAAVSLCDGLGGDRFAFITIDPSKPYVTLSVSWWMSKTVQHYLDRQLAYNARAFATISRMRQETPAEHRREHQFKAVTLLETTK